MGNCKYILFVEYGDGWRTPIADQPGESACLTAEAMMWYGMVWFIRGWITAL